MLLKKMHAVLCAKARALNEARSAPSFSSLASNNAALCAEYACVISSVEVGA